MIVVIGPLPPPIHGASIITEQAIRELAADDFSLLLSNTSPRQNTHRGAYHLSRLRAYMRGGLMILRPPHRTAPPKAVYLSLSGGFGLLYDLAITVIARVKKHPIIFHHHSFAYARTYSRIFSAIVRVAGTRQLHIALCPSMAEQLTQQYKSRARIEVISNIAFLETLESNYNAQAQRLDSIGYLSNISFEKGIDRFLDLIADLRANGSELKARIAGPFADHKVEEYVRRRMAEIGGIDYVGPVYGDQKTAFLSSIDILVFPTRYSHEAEPLVVYEAQAAGVIVAASDRGCLAHVIAPELLLDPAASNLRPLVKQILDWSADPDSFLAARRHLVRQLQKLVERQKIDRARFRSIFSDFRH